MSDKNRTCQLGPMLETQLDRMVSEKVNQLLNTMLDGEAEEITGAARYERCGGRKAYHAGHYERELTIEGRKDGGKGAQAQGDGLRVGSDRTVPASRGVGRGSVDRHVSGGRLHAPGR